jgi:hypothetical protein
MVRKIRSLVRPVTTWFLALVQSSLAAAWAADFGGTGNQAADAFKAMGPFTMMAMTFWFTSRPDRSEGDEGEVTDE